MSLKSERIKVEAKATSIVAASTAGSTIVIKNLGEKSCDLGNSKVATGKGFPLAGGAETSLDIDSGDSLFAICAENQTTELAVLHY